VKLRTSIIIPAPETTGHVFQSIAGVFGDGEGAGEALVLCNASAPSSLAERIEALGGGLPVRCLALCEGAPGAWRNVAVANTTGDAVLFLEAGDVVDRRYLAEAAHRLAQRTELAFVTAWARMPGPAGLHSLVKPTATLEAALASSEAIPAATMFRRAAWDAIGGFDATLSSCELSDFWIRLLAAGLAGDVIQEPLIDYAPSGQSAYRKRLEAKRHLDGIRRLFEKHQSLFRRYLVAALCERDRELRDWPGRYQHLLTRRDRHIGERDSLRREIQEITGELRATRSHGIDWGDFRRLLPVSPNWGWDRGVPIDRHYIERFIESYRADIRGAVLEVQEANYTTRFGGERVTQSDVIDIDVSNPSANITGDLRNLRAVASGSYDCIILTQTIHVIDDMRSVVREAARVLKPGGSLLVTLPCASRVCLEYGRDGDFWRVTEAGARRIFLEAFPSSSLEVRSFGSVLTNVAFLEGLAAHELSPEELEFHDPFYPLLVGVRAQRPSAAPLAVGVRNAVQGSAAVLLYHRVSQPTIDPWGLCVTPEDFRAQMTLVAREYRPMSLVELAAGVREGWLPDRAVAITFDDGYFDNLEVASPILLDLGIPATFLITSDVLLERREFWWDVLASIFLSPSAIPGRLEIDADGETLHLATKTDDDRQKAHRAIHERILKASLDERERVIDRLRDWAGWPSFGGLPRIMNRSDLQQLAERSRHSIGGHSTHHLSLPSQTEDVLRREVTENKKLLEIAVGRTVDCFAFPFGHHDDRSVSVVGELGYTAAVTCIEDVILPGVDPLRLPRLEVRPDGFQSFEERLQALFMRTSATSR
jgi:peptidoglycan/xylan/chitin deacetylase (PgdA/CDA1 family)